MPQHPQQTGVFSGGKNASALSGVAVPVTGGWYPVLLVAVEVIHHATRTTRAPSHLAARLQSLLSGLVAYLHHSTFTMFTCYTRPELDDDFDALIDVDYTQLPLEEKLIDDDEMAKRMRDLKAQIQEVKVDW